MTKYSTTRKKQSDQLLVRNLGPLKQRLRRRAEENGHSMEEEARNILRRALNEPGKPERGLGTEIAELFRGLGIREGDIRELRGYTIEPVKFDE